jgi:menaquinone-9 beta-reductase
LGEICPDFHLLAGMHWSWPGPRYMAGPARSKEQRNGPPMTSQGADSEEGPAQAGPGATAASPPSLPSHDLLIVGAGPAGAAAAMTARKSGLTVALLDKAAFPRDKLCGGGVTGRAKTHLDEVFGDLPGDLFLPCTEVLLRNGAATVGHLTEAPTVLMTMRRVFDGTLRARALAAGAEDFCGQRITDLQLETNSVRLADGRTLQGRVLIGADGVNSAVARALFGRAHDPERVGFALEAEVSGPPGAAMELDMTAASYGYGWDFPKRFGRTLGMGGIGLRNPDLRARFETWLRARGLDPAHLKIKGHHLPFGEFRPVPGRGAVLLVGDAAGLVDPITGEGIGWAVRSGQMAATSAALALAMGTPDRALAVYQKRMATVLRELGRARLLAKIVYHPRFQPGFLRLLARSERLQRKYLDLLAGQLDYADLRLGRLGLLTLRVLMGRKG